MREVAQTVREAGLEPWSAAGTAERQAWVADLADRGLLGDRNTPRKDWRADADKMLAAVDSPFPRTRESTKTDKDAGSPLSRE